MSELLGKRLEEFIKAVHFGELVDSTKARFQNDYFNSKSAPWSKDPKQACSLLELVGEVVSYAEVGALQTKIASAFKSCGSPIEALFLAGLIVRCSADTTSHGPLVIKGEKTISFGEPGYAGPLVVECQAKVGRYRADFLITACHDARWEHFFPEIPLARSVIVECDGHDFHEKTKSQASHDKRRDRELQKAGHTVFRYTGSDVWKDVGAAVNEVIEYLGAEISRLEETERTKPLKWDEMSAKKLYTSLCGRGFDLYRNAEGKLMGRGDETIFDDGSLRAAFKRHHDELLSIVPTGGLQ